MFVVNTIYESSSIQQHDTTAPVISGEFMSNISCRKAATAFLMDALNEPEINKVKFNNVTAGDCSEVEISGLMNVDFDEVQINN